MSAVDAPRESPPPSEQSPAARGPRDWRAKLRAFARRAWIMELGVYQSIYRLVFRRPRVPAGASAFRYHSPVLTLLVIFIVLSAVEIPIVDLIVHRWVWVRIPILVLGIWGVTWMLGLLFGYLTRPHAVGPEGIRVRQGAELDLDLPWDVVESVERSPQRVDKAPAVVDEPDGRTFAARIANETNVLIRLEHPLDVRLPQGRDRIEAVRLWTDDLDGFLSAVRTHIP
ncbi:hypothetical protein [Microbacterium trichothecenolyticum]|uniref:hypothetical protein n=1 Tax=Microbacterium trichothecenolyticum TaxID=69370 RepID=UPI0027E3958F|nr:hypothetical protein [Microbacterium trichothecenolyticum]